jgi:Ni/Co efflux regulator RcnB
MLVFCVVFGKDRGPGPVRSAAMRKLILVATMLAAPAALAQQQAAPQLQRLAPPRSPDAGRDAALDPNQMICRSQGTIGSRVARQRVCATRQQWLDQQRLDRLYTEKAQTNRIWPQ